MTEFYIVDFFDPSEFEGPRFDLYICKMLISILSWFFHTIFKDLTEQNAPFCVLLKNNLLGAGGGGGGVGVGGGKPRPPTAFSLSGVGMYAGLMGIRTSRDLDISVLNICDISVLGNGNFGTE